MFTIENYKREIAATLRYCNDSGMFTQWEWNLGLYWGSNNYGGW